MPSNVTARLTDGIGAAREHSGHNLQSAPTQSLKSSLLLRLGAPGGFDKVRQAFPRDRLIYSSALRGGAGSRHNNVSLNGTDRVYMRESSIEFPRLALPVAAGVPVLPPVPANPRPVAT